LNTEDEVRCEERTTAVGLVNGLDDAVFGAGHVLGHALGHRVLGILEVALHVLLRILFMVIIITGGDQVNQWLR
jgi:hypothetical protein